MWSTIRTVVVCVAVVASIAVWRDANATPAMGSLANKSAISVPNTSPAVAEARVVSGAALRSMSVGY